MIFTDVRFFVGLALCWAAFFAVPVRWRLWVLTATGIVFYVTFAPRDLPLVLGLTATTYVVARARATWVLVGVVTALFIAFRLGYDVSALFIGGVVHPTNRVLVPLGFSFLAFELLHYAIERRRGRIGEDSVGRLSAFALFFPCRVAGPIKRFRPFIDAVAAATPSIEHVYTGLVRMLIGLFKKLVLADVLGQTAAEVSYAATPGHVWKAVLAYSLQIYLDFSAYSDIAIGSALVLGITIPENFRWPYLSSNVQEFWGRWHISLSSWARDYVFTPLGQRLFKTRLRRMPSVIAAIAYLATFLLIGAWHGLTANYLLWGTYHGALVTGYSVYRAHVPARIAMSPLYNSGIATVGGALLTFVAVTLGWVLFMTPDMARSLAVLKIMFGVS